MAKVAHTALIGRDAELARVEEFLGAIGSGPAALLLEGEIGIGKTALWNQGLASSAAHGLRVLRCRPVECETQLAYAALGDLLADVPESAMSDLPVPQRRALEVALLRAEPEGPESLQRAVSLGLLGLLRSLAAQQPILLAIDDVHWLDPPSENALSFAVRRLEDERIGVFCARRGSGPEVPLGLDRALPEGRFERLALRGLERRRARSAAALRASGCRSRGVRSRASAAHPAAISTSRSRSGAPWPSAASGSIRRTSCRSRRACRSSCATASRTCRPRRARRRRSPRRSRARRRRSSTPRSRRAAASSAAAIEAGVLERDGERLAFAHPLLATVAYQLLSESERRALHARLAEILDDPEERARHLARAVDGPDEAVAAALATAGAPGRGARRAGRRRRAARAGPRR